MAAVSEPSRMSFNPSWMGSTYSKGVSARQSVDVAGSPPQSAPPDANKGQTGVGYPLAPPKLAKNRYGREELLALFPERSQQPPDDLKQNFPEFFVVDQQQPVCLSSHSDIEERLLHHGGINSSKAMSAVSHAERLHSGAPPGLGGPPPPAGLPPSNGPGFQPAWVDRGPPQSSRGGFGPPMRGGFASYGRGRGAEPNGPPPGRFMRGRGVGPAMGDRGRGGGGGFNFNPRAQGLYDPKDPRDRPRQRVRSVGEGVEGAERGAHSGPGRGGAWAARSHGPHGWGQQRSEDGGPMPEWMDESDEEVEEKDLLGTGSFDDDGQFMRTSMDEHKDSDKDKTGESDEMDSKCVEPSANTNAKQSEPIAIQTVPANPPAQNAWFAKSAPLQPDTNAKVEKVQEQTAPGAAEPLPQRQPSMPQPQPDVEDGFAKLQKDAESLVRSFSEESSPLRAGPRHRPQLTTQPPATLALAPNDHKTLREQPPVQSMAKNNEVEHWLYLDPKRQIQGPFDSAQMAAWFGAGYFTMTLLVKRTVDSEFCTLGDLIKRHGKVPFNPDSSPAPTPTKSDPNRMSTGLWAEEQAKVTDPLQHRLAAFQLQQQKEIELRDAEQRRVAEITRKEREEKDREMKRLEELDRLQKMELEAKRQRELEEKRVREETERRRLAAEAEERRKQLEQLARLQAEAENERMRQIKEEQERRQQEEMKRKREEEMRRQQEMQRLRDEEIRRQQQEAAMERMRREKEAEMRQRQQQRVAVEELFSAAPKPSQGGGAGRDWTMMFGANQNQPPPRTTAPAWNAASQAPPQMAQTVQTNSGSIPAVVQSLVEIQREEERQLMAEQRQQQEMDIQRRHTLQAMNVTTGSVWGNASKQISWDKPNIPESAGPWGNAAPKAPTVVHGFWDEPSSPPIERSLPPIQPQKRTENTQPVRNENVHESQPKSQQETAVKRLFTQTAALKSGGTEDPFHNWVIRQVKRLNNDIDAETLAAFLKGVDSPEEVEDYVVSYFGESSQSREFLQEFLRRRCESRKKASEDRDDLSMAAAATVSQSAGAGSDQAQQHSRKKKKGARHSRPVDGAALGFTATADPNRMNAGAIDLEGV